MVTYRGILDVPRATVQRVCSWLYSHRKKHDQRTWQRALSPWMHALLILRWMKNNTRIACLARDFHISQATAYRYIHEALGIIATRSPNLVDVARQAVEENWTYACLDGTLIYTNACHQKKTGTKTDLWFSGKHHHGGNIQVLCDPSGYPVWTSPVSPGSTHDLTAARDHVFTDLLPATSQGLRILADKGYVGASSNVLTPIKGKHLSPDNECYNKLHTGKRAIAERGNALLKQTWKCLQHVTLTPTTIGTIVQATLVLTHLQRGTR